MRARVPFAGLLLAAIAAALPTLAADPARLAQVATAAQRPVALQFGSVPPALLFFGFTHCGVTCPVALVTAKQLLHDASVMRAPTIVFVTLDPLSDDVPALHRFLDAFDSRLIGLTGSPTQVWEIADRFGVGIQHNDGRLEHSSVWYLLDGHGQVRRTYAYNTPASQVAADFERLRQASSGDMP
jgi:cytochrome oxidase Cu insertion factor (SCO1/SenC/PrrC family)